jgi:uncharacterized membrane protein YbhN (UPF0104 family)
MIVAAAVLILAAALLARTLGRYDLVEVGEALGRLPSPQLAAAALLTVASYTVLTFVDLMAVRYAGRAVSYPKVALASFIALSIGHSLGFAALSSGAVRFRFYRRWGLTVGEIARAIVFCGLFYISERSGSSGRCGSAVSISPRRRPRSPWDSSPPAAWMCSWWPECCINRWAVRKR